MASENKWYILANIFTSFTGSCLLAMSIFLAGAYNAIFTQQNYMGLQAQFHDFQINAIINNLPNWVHHYDNALNSINESIIKMSDSVTAATDLAYFFFIVAMICAGLAFLFWMWGSYNKYYHWPE